jgi:hypothetical protein
VQSILKYQWKRERKKERENKERIKVETSQKTASVKIQYSKQFKNYMAKKIKSIHVQKQLHSTQYIELHVSNCFLGHPLFQNWP